MTERDVGSTDDREEAAAQRIAGLAPVKRRRLRDAFDRVLARVDAEMTRAAEADSLPWQHDRYW